MSSVRVCGVGCGGPMRQAGEAVSPINIPVWRDFPLRTRLAEHTGLAVHIDNDAKALALGEAWKGRARGVANFIGMVVSTGVGVASSSTADCSTATRNAGHIGHVVVEPEGTELDTHVQGVLEAEVSGTGIAAARAVPPKRPTKPNASGLAGSSAEPSVRCQSARSAARRRRRLGRLGFGDTFFLLPKSRSTGWPICNTRRARSSHRPNSAPTVR